MHSSNSLRECLDVVDIVLGFLSSGGGKADKNLGDYIDNTLRMSIREFSAKVSATVVLIYVVGRLVFWEISLFPSVQLCTLGNILSLWEILAVALAKRLTLSEQVHSSTQFRIYT